MRYQVTCKKCQRSFAIDAAGGQLVQCLCPYCGTEMKANVPDADGGPYQNGGRRSDAGHQDNNGCLKTLAVVLLALLIVLGVGGWIYYDYLRTQSQRLEDARKAEAYRQHYDSLMQQRERQAAEWAEPVGESSEDFSMEGEIGTETESNTQSYETNQDSLQH